MISLPKLAIPGDLSQFLYALIVIILIPSALAFNTIYLLRSFTRDMDYELNNKALLVESVLAAHIQDSLDDTEKLQSQLTRIVKTLPEIKAIEIYRPEETSDEPVFSTTETTRYVFDQQLNDLAWGSTEAYSKQIEAKVGSDKKERIWVVVKRITDDQGKRLGLINLYLSGSEIDAITARTTRDSLYLLFFTMLVVLLLLVNHFRFFEVSILFKKLSEIDKLKDDFISMASHELKTPLTAISGYAYIMLKSPVILANQELKKWVWIIEESAKRQSHLVEDILNVSRIEQNRLKMTLGDYDLREIIQSVTNELLPQASMKRLPLLYQKPPQPIIVSCDQGIMFQIMTNLIGNAVKYTPSGNVSVYHQINNKVVKTFIKDTGVGISEENRKKLFTKFTRIYNEKTKDVGGTGLGLWITKQLIEKMKGTVAVESIQNQGTQFIVTFPLKS